MAAVATLSPPIAITSVSGAWFSTFRGLSCAFLIASLGVALCLKSTLLFCELHFWNLTLVDV